jgi:hypothetical protein
MRKQKIKPICGDNMRKFYVDECPERIQVFKWIQSQLPWDSAIKDVTASYSKYCSKYKNMMNFEFEFLGDINGLKKSVEDALHTYGFFGWKTKEGDEQGYGGYSITYNPDLQYKDQDIHQSNLGTSKNSGGEFFNGSVQHHENLKNSYFDGLSFNEFTPAAKIGYMGKLLEEINNNITITRSRLGILKGNHPGETRYHMDSDVYELVRLNIPITGDDSFVFQFEGYEPYALEVGKAYTWQTKMSHRVMCVRPSEIYRANMVIGLSPWLSYNKEERYWYPNEFFGKKHPFDIIVDGHVTDKIRFLRWF